MSINDVVIHVNESLDTEPSLIWIDNFFAQV
jgi:hypothetical protein